MNFSLKDFLKDAAIYSIAGWVSRMLGIILIPIYTRIFSPADYGVLDLIATSTAFLVMGMQLGLGSAITRFFSAASDEKERKALFATVFWTKILTYGPLLTALILFSPKVSHFLFGNQEHLNLIRWASVSVLTSALWTYLLLLYRLRFLSFAYSILSSIYLLCNFGLTVYLVVFAQRGLIGIYWAKVITDTVLVSLLLFPNRHFILKPEFYRLKELLHFGLPLVPSALAYYVMQYLDRYFIQIYWGESQLGLYAIAYQMISVLGLLAGGFSVAWAPFVWSIYAQSNGPEMIRIIFKAFSLSLALFAFGLGLFAREILVIFTTPEYIAAADVAYLIALAMVVYYTTVYFSVGIDGSKKTHHRLWAGIVAAMANFGLNWLFIPKFGLAGAAWATLLSYLIYGVYVMVVSQRLYPVAYGMKRFGSMVAIFLLAMTLMSRVEEISFLVFVIKIAVFLLVGSISPLLVGFITWADLVSVYSKIHSLTTNKWPNAAKLFGR